MVPHLGRPAGSESGRIAAGEVAAVGAELRGEVGARLGRPDAAAGRRAAPLFRPACLHPRCGKFRAAVDETGWRWMRSRYPWLTWPRDPAERTYRWQQSA